MNRLATLGIALATLSNCLDPTEIIVDIKSDVMCTSQQGVTIVVGSSVDDPNATMIETNACDGGAIGTLAVTPTGDVGDPVAIRVTLGVTKAAAQCAPPFDGCIVARRSLRYAPHTPLHLPIDLDQDCLNQGCDPNSTCLHGSCVDSGVPTCPNDICSLPDAGAPPPQDAGGCVTTPPTKLPLSGVLASTPRIGRTTNGYVIAWLTSGGIMAETIDASGAAIANAVSITTATTGAKINGIGTNGTNYVVLHEAGPQLELAYVDFTGTLVTSPGWGSTVGPLGGLFYEAKADRFVTAGIVNGTGQLLIATPQPTQGAMFTPAILSGVSLAHGPTNYYATMHDSAMCYLATCTLTTCAIGPPTSNCTGLRIAANATDTFQMQVSGTQLTAFDSKTLVPIQIGAVDSPDAIQPLATGSTPFRGLWRASDALQEQTFPGATRATLDTMGYAAASGVGAGFEAVADDEATSTAYAVIYYKSGGLWFTHQCN
jgi:hypothetical protein